MWLTEIIIQYILAKEKSSFVYYLLFKYIISTRRKKMPILEIYVKSDKVEKSSYKEFV